MLDRIDDEIIQAIVELKQAEQNFQYADHDFIYIAILQLNASEMKLSALVALKMKWTQCNGSMSKE
jgi:hypothetical protein